MAKQRNPDRFSILFRMEQMLTSLSFLSHCWSRAMPLPVRNHSLQLEHLEGRVVPATFQPLAKVFAISDIQADDSFGTSVAIDGKYAVVGAKYATNAAGDTTGAVYFYQRYNSGTSTDETDDIWTLQRILTAPDAADGDEFGASVSLIGTNIIVGAPKDDDAGDNSGSVYLFSSSGVQREKFTASDAASNDFFGTSVNYVGNTLVVGAPGNDDSGNGSGSAYVFVSAGRSGWSEQQKLTASDADSFDNFGYAVAVSGDSVVISALNDEPAGAGSGSAYVFTRSGSTWSEQDKLTASDGAKFDSFGQSVGISGDSVVVGAPGNSDDGDSSGSAYVFTRSGTTWSEQQKLTASDAETFDSFGISVGISGDTVVVGVEGDDDAADAAGAVFSFKRSGTTWTEHQKLTAPDAGDSDIFGRSVGIDGDSVIVGAYIDTVGGVSAAGSAYMYSTLGGSSFQPIDKVTAIADIQDGDGHNAAVAIDGDVAVIGAHKFSNASGSDIGAAYVFARFDNACQLD